MNVCGTLTHLSAKEETTQMFVDWGLEKLWLFLTLGYYSV